MSFVRSAVVTIGNFDGVHLGHQSILRRVVARAQELGAEPVVLTFDPHPARIFAPDRAPKLIQTVGQKVRSLKQLGIESVQLLPFSTEFAKLSPREFAERILRNTVHARVVMVGEDFRFGHKQSGNIETLRELGAELGFDVEPMPLLDIGSHRVSSTAIRTLIRRGKVSRACRLMGAPFALAGPVVSGKGIGSKQTVPTLNLAAENELLPATGVYITRTRLAPEGDPVPSITNVGYRPTFDGESLTVETFLLTGPVEAPDRIEVEFLSYVRGERKFPTPEALRTRILRDVGTAQRFHARFGPVLAKSRVG